MSPGDGFRSTCGWADSHAVGPSGVMTAVVITFGVALILILCGSSLPLSVNFTNTTLLCITSLAYGFIFLFCLFFCFLMIYNTLNKIQGSHGLQERKEEMNTLLDPEITRATGLDFHSK